MCLPCRLLTALLGVVLNASIGIWTLLALTDEHKAWSSVFLVPATTSCALLFSPRGSPPARIAGVVVLLVGIVKALAAAALGGFAAQAAASGTELGQVGTAAFATLATFLGASALSDMWLGWTAVCAQRAARRCGCGGCCCEEGKDVGVELMEDENI